MSISLYNKQRIGISGSVCGTASDSRGSNPVIGKISRVEHLLSIEFKSRK